MTFSVVCLKNFGQPLPFSISEWVTFCIADTYHFEVKMDGSWYAHVPLHLTLMLAGGTSTVQYAIFK